MGKVDRLLNRVEPFAALFWALGNVLANTLHRHTQTMSLYEKSWFHSQRRRAGSHPFPIKAGYLSMLPPQACVLLTPKTQPATTLEIN